MLVIIYIKYSVKYRVGKYELELFDNINKNWNVTETDRKSNCIIMVKSSNFPWDLLKTFKKRSWTYRENPIFLIHRVQNQSFQTRTTKNGHLYMKRLQISIRIIVWRTTQYQNPNHSKGKINFYEMCAPLSRKVKFPSKGERKSFLRNCNIWWGFKYIKKQSINTLKLLLNEKNKVSHYGKKLKSIIIQSTGQSQQNKYNKGLYISTCALYGYLLYDSFYKSSDARMLISILYNIYI